MFIFVYYSIIIFMTSCKLVTGNYKGLYLACIMQTYGGLLLYGAFLATVAPYCISEAEGVLQHPEHTPPPDTPLSPCNN